MKSIQQIIDWLKEHGEPSNDGKSFAFTAKGGPHFMDFNAEWQDWSFQKPGSEVLYLGYFSEQNGDLCPDPQLKVRLQDGEIESVIATNGFGTIEVVGNEYTQEFADIAWDRHMKDRTTMPVE